MVESEKVYGEGSVVELEPDTYFAGNELGE